MAVQRSFASEIVRNCLGILVEALLTIHSFAVLTSIGLSLGLIGRETGWLSQDMERDTESMCICVLTILVFLLGGAMTKLVGGVETPYTGHEYRHPWKHTREFLFVLSNPLFLLLSLHLVWHAKRGLSLGFCLSAILFIVIEICRIRSRAGKRFATETRLAIVFVASTVFFYVLIGFSVIERLKGVKTNTVGLTAEESEVAIFRQEKEKPSDSFKRFEPQFNVKDQVLLVRRSTEAARSPQAVPTEAKEMLRSTPERETDSAASSSDIVRLAAEKSQLMDDLLNEEPIPSDYGQVMVGLFRDRGQDVYTRDFAVQHIGLYAEALHRRGAYDPTSPEASQLRKALDAAADETRTIVAAAAFRALDDLAAFDPHVDARRLEPRLVACAADASASSAARVMAAQLCGERKVLSSRSLLKRLADDPKENAVVRKSSACALRALEGR